MVVQCIARKSYGLPLTLLEIHTLIHAICAAMMYALWFNKPLDIAEASVIQVPQSLDGLIACLFLHSKFYHMATLDGVDEHTKRTEISVTSRSLQYCEQSKPLVTSTRATSQVLRDYTARRPKHFRKVFRFPGNLSNTVKITQFWIPITDRFHCDIVLSDQLATCALAASGYTGRFRSGSKSPDSVLHLDEEASKGAVFLLDRHQNMIALHHTEALPGSLLDCLASILMKVVGSCTGLINEYDFPSIKTGFAATLIHAMYGGVHLSALEVGFPSELEQMLWRASCILIVTFMIAGVFGVNGTISLYEIAHHPMSGSPLTYTCSRSQRIIAYLSDMLLLIMLPSSLLLLLATSAARCYIVVESFISLRVVPAGAYRTIEWADYIPHI